MIERNRQNMNITVLKRPNNYISHDKLNFKRSGPRMSSDTRQTRQVDLWHHQQAAGVIFTCVVYVYRQCILYNGGRTTTVTIHSVTREAGVGLHVIYTNAQIFISPTIMAYSGPLIYQKNVLNNVLLKYTMSASILFKTYKIYWCYIAIS